MSTHGQFNTKSPTIKRILKEAAELASTPDPTLHASPLDSNLFEWHFTLAGPPSTPYSSGIYHGRIILPPTYPLRPPSFRFLTPSGRFETNREICLSISGHHEESWQPAWGVRTALLAIRSFMKEEAGGQVGGLEMREGGRRRLAAESRGWRCAGCGGRTNEEVIRESADRAEGAQGGGGWREEETVPEELRLGYRDELGKQKDEAGGEAVGPAAGDPTSSSSATATTATRSVTPSSSHASLPALTPAQPPLLAPATNTTSPLPSLPTIPAASSSTLVSPPPPLPRHPAALIPTRTSPIRPARPLHSPRRASPPPGSNAAAAVPAWIDKAIVGVLVGLAVMVLRKVWLYL